MKEFHCAAVVPGCTRALRGRERGRGGLAGRAPRARRPWDGARAARRARRRPRAHPRGRVGGRCAIAAARPRSARARERLDEPLERDDARRSRRSRRSRRAGRSAAPAGAAAPAARPPGRRSSRRRRAARRPAARRVRSPRALQPDRAAARVEQHHPLQALVRREHRRSAPRRGRRAGAGSTSDASEPGSSIAAPRSRT